MSGETERQPSGWTVDTLARHFEVRIGDVKDSIADLRVMLDERYVTQTKAVDAAFASQQTAMQTALAAAERAVATALLSAEKAVAKAETAADKRFEAVNEFRSQLTDQAATFLSRTEGLTRVDAITQALAEHVTRANAEMKALEDRMLERANHNAQRLDLMQGKSTGVNAGWGYLVGVVGLLATITAVVLSFRGV